MRGAAGKIRLTPAEWKQTIGLLTLIPVMAIAIIPNNQIFNAYLVWGDQDFNLTFAGNRLPTTWLVTLDAIVSVTFLFLVALFWSWRGKKRNSLLDYHNRRRRSGQKINRMGSSRKSKEDSRR